ncbi:MAG: oxidoreductase [Alphaproteobacteria bacterium]|nr:oxidoreductase [Alphaproteobacteria bacterium]
MAETFKALMARETDGKAACEFEDLTVDDLPHDGDALVSVAYSTLNYKDGLAIKGNQGKVMRSLPMVPGIDLSGVVEDPGSSSLNPGDEVVVTGWGLSETAWGGYTQKARLNSDWLLPLPAGISLQQSMAIGTAGFTAMLSVMALEHMGLEPSQGEVLVTGAAGGVGSIAVAILANLGYDVAASTGRAEQHDYLKSLGAKSIVDRAELGEEGGPMRRARWAGGVDTVGSKILVNSMAQIAPNGSIAVCGLAAGADLPATVIPLILRGVSLLGINSVYVSNEKRQVAWDRLTKELPMDLLDSMTEVVPFAELPRLAGEILKGQVRGRTVVDLNA